MNKDFYEKLREEREISNKSYAVKIVETGFFALVALIAIAVVGALLELVIL